MARSPEPVYVRFRGVPTTLALVPPAETSGKGVPLGANALRFTSTTGRPVAAYAPMPEGTDAPFAGTKHPRLSELTTATYSSMIVTQPQNALDVSLQFEVTASNACANGSPCATPGSGYTTVVYEPYMNLASETLNEWHRHYVRSGKVWSTRAIAGQGTTCTQAAPCDFDEFIELNPNALVQTAKLRTGQVSGDGWPGYEGYVDDFRLGFDGDFVRYDFGG